jgi:hypothetical protein
MVGTSAKVGRNGRAALYRNGGRSSSRISAAAGSQPWALWRAVCPVAVRRGLFLFCHFMHTAFADIPSGCLKLPIARHAGESIDF